MFLCNMASPDKRYSCDNKVCSLFGMICQQRSETQIIFQGFICTLFNSSMKTKTNRHKFLINIPVIQGRSGPKNENNILLFCSEWQ